MTEAAKAAANRQNAQRSTGPRSVRGKARASRNAIRHGLLAATPSHGVMAARIEAMAAAMLGSEPRHGVNWPLAVALADADYHLQLVRAERIKLHEQIAEAAERLESYNANARQFLAMVLSLNADLSWEATLAAGRCRVVELYRVRGVLATQRRERQKLIQAMAELLKALYRFDRYEEQALAQRRKALQAFMLHCLWPSNS